MNQSPFFIVGEARSGTTLLRLMLDTHPALAIPQESHFIPYLYDKRHFFGDLTQVDNRRRLIEAVADIADIAWGKDSWAPGLRQNANALAETAEPTFAGVMHAAFLQATKEKQPCRWGEKTPRYVLHLPLLIELFPDAQFIHLVRDGRDVASSLFNVPFGANTPIAAGCGWIKCVKAGEDFVEKYPSQAITVRYEDLVSEPKEQLDRLCSFLKIEYDPQMMQYRTNKVIKQASRENNPSNHQLLAQEPTTSRVGSFKTRLTERQRRLFESEAGPMLIKLGYPAPETSCHVGTNEAFFERMQELVYSIWRTPKDKRAKLALWVTRQRIASLRRRFTKR